MNRNSSLNPGRFRNRSRFANGQLTFSKSNRDVIQNTTLLSVSARNMYTVPIYIDTIAKHCFKNSSNTIVSVLLPSHSNLSNIESRAFAVCTCLTTVNLHKYRSLKAIQVEAFANCNNLVSIPLPRSLSDVQTSAFENCSSLRIVKQNNNNNLRYIGNSAFQMPV